MATFYFGVVYVAFDAMMLVIGGLDLSVFEFFKTSYIRFLAGLSPEVSLSYYLWSILKIAIYSLLMAICFLNLGRIFNYSWQRIFTGKTIEDLKQPKAKLGWIFDNKLIASFRFQGMTQVNFYKNSLQFTLVIFSVLITSSVISCVYALLVSHLESVFIFYIFTVI